MSGGDYTLSQIGKYANFALPGKRNSSGRSFRTTCPIHKGQNLNFAFDLETGLWYCHSKCKLGGDLIKLEMMLTNVDFETAVQRVAEIIGAQYRKRAGSGKTVASYIYVDPLGRPVAEKIRSAMPDGSKSFSWRHRVDDSWLTGGSKNKFLYNLPSVVSANTVLIVEGEKTADRLNRTQWSPTEKLRLVATCGPDGSNGWLDSFSAYLVGKNVFIMPDNDEPGRKHRDNIIASISRLPVPPASLRVVEFTEFPEKFDAFDFLDQHEPFELITRLRAAKDQLPSLTTEPKQQEIFVDMATYAADFKGTTDWIIPGVIHAGASGLIVANPKAGKSLSMLDLLLSIATGTPWLGMPIERRMRVAYISREDHPETTMPRFKRLRAGKGLLADPTDWISFSSTLQMDEFLLENEDHVTRMIHALKKRGVQFAVFDVFRRLHLGDENDNSQIAKVLASLTRIQREAGCQVVLVHHLNKQGEGLIFNRIRGASAIHGWAEWSIGITGQVDDAENGSEIREVVFETKAGRPHVNIFWRPQDGLDSLSLARIEKGEIEAPNGKMKKPASAIAKPKPGFSNCGL